MKNNAKNRSLDFLPSETLLVTLWTDLYQQCLSTANKHRVILKQGHPDYIHASFVNVRHQIPSYKNITSLAELQLKTCLLTLYTRVFYGFL